MEKKYITDKWFVSPWDYEDEVTQDFHFADKVEIHDITLRDGEQQAGIIFRKKEKIKIAEKLAECGVHRIEAGMPAVSAQDTEAIKVIVREKFGPKIFAFSRCMIDDVKRAIDCGVDGIVNEIPSSEHIIQYAYQWPLQKAVDLSIESTRFAHENGLYTVFFPIDFSRADKRWGLDLIEKVATQGHMDALAVVDTFGGLSVHAVPYLFKKIRERINKPLEAHFHDDFGLGVATTLAALTCGASVAHVTVSGIGERAGNTPLEDLVLSLKTMYGQDIGIKTDRFFGLSKLVCSLARHTLPPNRPIVGETLFNVESGIIADWLCNCGDEHILELTPFKPELVGQKAAQIVLGKNSGISSVVEYMEKIGKKIEKEKALEILAKVKKKSFEKKGLLTEEEFKSIAEKSLSE